NLSNEKKEISKPKILCLHAYKQNPKVLKRRSHKIFQRLSKEFDLYIPCAPVQLTKAVNDPDPHCWYQYGNANYQTTDDGNDGNNNNNNNNNMKDLLEQQYAHYLYFDQCLTSLAKYCIENGPFDGIFAFSQGATIATLLCYLSCSYLVDLKDDTMDTVFSVPMSALNGMVHKYGNVFGTYLFREKYKQPAKNDTSASASTNTLAPAIVLISGHLYPLPMEMKGNYDIFVQNCKRMSTQNLKHNTNVHPRMHFKSLHIFGESDDWVHMDKSKELFHLFQHTNYIIHKGGHIVPDHLPNVVNAIHEFFVKNILSS
ncbi:hypothetical protein RFI_30605, partial [Reticulomyxa filosa]